MSRFSGVAKRVVIAMAGVLGAAAISAAPADAASRWVTYTEEGVPIVWEHCYTWEAGGYYGTCGRQL
ncbi:hypothetical protein [Nonomuraea sp. CA-141351]|uniref:hypothetical protein n=1 Tax=Nonomuraea sp. CA-141351 TaxID=3239996 RepID=UPI003D914185